MNVHVNDIVGIVATPGGGGYFLVGKDGGVFTFGNAPFFGSLPGIGVSVNDITGIASTPDGKGYYVVGANGAVYAFGDATSHGSLPGLGVTVSNIVSIVPTPDGGGYWLIGSDGGVFAFGDATTQGSLPGWASTSPTSSGRCRPARPGRHIGGGWRRIGARPVDADPSLILHAARGSTSFTRQRCFRQCAADPTATRCLPPEGPLAPTRSTGGSASTATVLSVSVAV